MMMTVMAGAWLIAGQAGAQTSAAPAMSVADYLKRHASVQARMKLIEPDLRAMSGVTEQAIIAYRAEAEAAQADGRAPRGCLPLPGSQNKLSGAEVLAALRETPSAQRTVPVQEALFAFFDRRYPCVGGKPAGPPAP